jgi:hypothetical protein
MHSPSFPVPRVQAGICFMTRALGRLVGWGIPVFGLVSCGGSEGNKPRVERNGIVGSCKAGQPLKLAEGLEASPCTDHRLRSEAENDPMPGFRADLGSLCRADGGTWTPEKCAEGRVKCPERVESLSLREAKLEHRQTTVWTLVDGGAWTPDGAAKTLCPR